MIKNIWVALTSILLFPRDPGNILKIIEIFIGILEEDINDPLEIIERNTFKLIHEKFKSGLDLLSDAKVIWEDDRQKAFQYINEARLAFIGASNLEDIPFNAKASEYVAICHECLGNRNNAKEWYEKSYNGWIEYHKMYAKEIEHGLNGLEYSYFTDFAFCWNPYSMVFYRLRKYSSINSFINNLKTVFHIEMQLKHLQTVMEAYNINFQEFQAVYSPKIDAISVVRKGLGKHTEGVTCYDKVGNEIERFVYGRKIEYTV